MRGGAWDDPYWADRITPRETPESLERLRQLAYNRGKSEEETMTTTTAPESRGTSLKPEFIRLRNEGWSLRKIAAEHGLSYERVRQVVGDDDPAKQEGWMSTEDRERLAEAERVGAWVTDNGPVARDRVREVMGITEHQLSTMIREGHVPEHLVVMPARDVPYEHSQADMVAAMQRVWEQVKETDPAAPGLPHSLYERYRSPDEPSAPLIVSRHGWETMCEIASVPPGPSNRPKSSYVSGWTDEDILRGIAEWIELASNRGIRATYVGYEEFQRGRDDLPSGSTVRNRMRDAGIPMWPQILDAAKEYVA